MPPIDPAKYYAERDVEHSAQGDIHLDLSFAVATVAGEDAPPRGARKRPGDEPPGQRGYSHPFRLVAPIMSLTALKALGVKANELRKLKDSGFLQGLMYLPQTDRLRLDEPVDDKEFEGDAAALLYRPALVTQALLDRRERAHRLSEPAQRVLIAALTQSVSPNRFDPFDEALRAPDLSDSWSG
ncbi:MAG TPA: hypothetical protein VFC52_02855 [Solirubrobacterales bacterium]|nr:hypothetical protein [Solirubrobacterales bacterium]